MSKKKNTVISICSKGHADVWKLTSNLLPIMVAADDYIVYVPESEIAFFEEITDSSIRVESQESLGKEFYDKLKSKLESAENGKRFGWYLQQFYKIEAIQRADSQLVTIWDADCVPVSAIEVMNKDNKVVYVNSSREFHIPYFENIERLLGMTRIQTTCFVIPSFPMKRNWIKEFIDFVEQTHGMKWYDAIIKTTDFSQMSGFSETETLGTWVANKYPDEWISRTGTWERYGQSRFGYARNIKPNKIIKLGKENNLEIITFENWDTRGIKKIIKAIRRSISKFRSAGAKS
jgi:hypothetical protein